jgi:hypothetical protein
MPIASNRSLALAIFALLLAVPAAEAEVLITRRACDWLVRHQPAPDVAYQPGVDVHGQPVAPADLDESGQIVLPEVIIIPIEVWVRHRDRHRISRKSVLWNAEADVGTVEFRDNRVYYEGQLLGDAEADAMADACREAGFRP